MTTRNLLEIILKMLALLLLIDAMHNAINFSYYFFVDFHNIQEARNIFLASGMSVIFAPLLLSIVLFFSTNFLAKKLAPKNDESRLIVNISAYDLQVIILFSIAVVVALMSITPLIGFSIDITVPSLFTLNLSTSVYSPFPCVLIPNKSAGLELLSSKALYLT